jgi:hypothetical protein
MIDRQDHQTNHDPHEALGRREQLARLVRLDTPFSQVVSSWAGFGVHGEQTAPTSFVDVTDEDARLLDLPVGTSVTRRDIHLVSVLTGPVFLAAAITELVYEPRLGLDLAGRRAVRSGPDPLDSLVNHLRRVVCYILRPHHAPEGDTAGDPQPDHPALKTKAILAQAGTPVAVAVETVYWRLLTHRQPSVVLPYAVPRPMLARVPR